LSKRSFSVASLAPAFAMTALWDMVDLLNQREDDPIELFRKWMADAEASEPNDPTAASLATSTSDGHPSVRMVLIKTFDRDGLSFYTNGGSRKGREIEKNPLGALCFHWKTLRRQVRAEGSISELPMDVVDYYFHTRSRGSQIAAAVSEQSRPLVSREDLVRQVDDFSRRYERQPIPRPVDWKGYLLKPISLEFWSDGPNRLHDRVLFRAVEHAWTRQRLYP
jgi:pyridoxamine 5'-phosphate oxidase